MAEDAEGAPYSIVFIETGETSNSSRDFTGKGIATYPNGEIYEGSYLNGVRQGKGKYTYANGDRYEGDWFQNKKHGIGKMFYNQKGEYFGQFEHGRRHGEGLFTYLPSKDVYSGWWKYGKKNGHGTYVYADTGMRLQGEWSDGKIVNGKWVFPNGTYYSGQFQYNKPTGDGKWVFQSGNTLEGTYKQTVLPSEEEVEEGQEPKVNLKLDWISSGRLYDSAKLVNHHENI